MNKMRIAHSALASLLLAGSMSACIDSEVLVSPVNTHGDYVGCLDKSKAIDTSRIRVFFEFPNDASKVTIYRDGGTKVATVNSREQTFIEDDNLIEGQTYRYSCEASFNGTGRIGYNVVTVTTISANPPTFDGIISAEKLADRTVRVSWNPGTGVPTDHFQIFVKPIDYKGGPFPTTLAMDPLTPELTVPVATRYVDLTDLGDELTYAFGVRACTANNICDKNTVAQHATISDLGAPLSVGATLAVLDNGIVSIFAPWTHKDGGITNRFVYRKSIKKGDPCPKDLPSYSVPLDGVSVTVSDLSNPDTVILDPLDPSNPATFENKTLCYIVKDADAGGKRNSYLNVVSVDTGDLTKPNFGGITDLRLPNPDPAQPKLLENMLIASFTAVASQDGHALELPDIMGPDKYLVYVTEGIGGTVDACKETAPVQILNASDYAINENVKVTLSGLKRKTGYSVCIKAKDKAGNISATTNQATASTLDKTEPTFDGIQTLQFHGTNDPLNPDADYGYMVATWLKSPSADVDHFNFKYWVITRTGTTRGPSTMQLTVTGHETGFKWKTGDPFFDDNETLYLLVDACDVDNNCTKFDDVQAKSALVPDRTPPKDFTGITSATSTIEGVATVTWNTPSDSGSDHANWLDYVGFIIYEHSVVGGNDVLTERSRCKCTPDCLTAFQASATQTCNVTGLVPFKSYELHVRGFDAAGNIGVPDLPPSDVNHYYSMSVVIKDSTPPSFTPMLNPRYENGKVTLYWNPASDNQYPYNPDAKITYNVYRKKGTNFNDPSNPEGAAEDYSAAPGHTTYKIVSGRTSAPASDSPIYDDASIGTPVPQVFEKGDYYYLVCAYDGSNNQKCDSTGRLVRTVDTVAPTFNSFTGEVTQTLAGTKTFTFSWSASDDQVTDGTKLPVYVYRSISAKDTPADPDPSLSPYQVIYGSDGAGNGSLVEDYTKLEFQNTFQYYNYIFMVYDGTNWSVQKKAHIQVNNLPPTAPVITGYTMTPDGSGTPTSIDVGGVVKAAAVTLLGTCDSSAGNTTTAEGILYPGSVTPPTIASMSCSGGILKIRIKFATNETHPSIKVTTTDSYANNAVLDNFWFFNSFTCPTNYLAVEHNSDVGQTTDFCVAKYEMKATVGHPEATNPSYDPTLANGGDGNIPNTDVYYPASRPDGTPWVNVTQPQAAERCAALSFSAQPGYSLISNPQWQTVSRAIESVPKNWSGGAVGSGVLNRGNSRGLGAGAPQTAQNAAIDSSLARGVKAPTAGAVYALAAAATGIPANDNDGYMGTGITPSGAWSRGTYVAGEELKRTHNLPNGETIWDIAGNVHELVATLLSAVPPDVQPNPGISAAGWIEFSNVTYFPTSGGNANFNRIIFSPNGSYSSAQNAGEFYGSTGTVILRGGSWTTGSSPTLYTGIFTTQTNWTSINTANSVGFRCVYDPYHP